VHLSLIGFVFPPLHYLVDIFLALFILFFSFVHLSSCFSVDFFSSNSIFVVRMLSVFMITEF
jgi:hypothetical protein